MPSRGHYYCGRRLTNLLDLLLCQESHSPMPSEDPLAMSFAKAHAHVQLDPPVLHDVLPFDFYRELHPNQTGHRQL